jgi:hypothetical protein
MKEEIRMSASANKRKFSHQVLSASKKDLFIDEDGSSQDAALNIEDTNNSPEGLAEGDNNGAINAQTTTHLVCFELILLSFQLLCSFIDF